MIALETASPATPTATLPEPPAPKPSNSSVNILMVDDESRNLDVLETILEAPDRRLIRALSAEEALMALVQADFTVIVLDVQMPGMNGFELARMIKQRKRSQQIPIIFLTAYYQEDKDVLSGYDLGAVDYLTKPVDPRILQSKISVFVELFRTHRALVESNRALEQEMLERKRLEAEVLQATEREQQRIAQDLHDGLGQQLAGISCLCNSLKKDLAKKSSPHTADAAKISMLLDVAVAETRALARGLHPIEHEPNGLMSALESLAGDATQVFKVSCKFECPQPIQVHEFSLATDLFRIAQEALANAVKHGHASRIVISLSSTLGSLVLKVSDNGAGFDPKEHDLRQQKGIGLRIMHYRAAKIGGTLTFQRTPESGIDVICSVPVSGNNGTQI
jgi:signal transduction histidine kinase